MLFLTYIDDVSQIIFSNGSLLLYADETVLTGQPSTPTTMGPGIGGKTLHCSPSHQLQARGYPAAVP